MASSVLPTSTPRAIPPRLRQVGSTLATWAARGAAAVNAARHRNWSPALTVSGLGCIDIAAWETFGRGAGWLALGVSLLLFDFSREKPEKP